MPLRLSLSATWYGLMQMADDGSVKKALCKEETVSPDGLKYTFTLRDDVYWSNGDQVTAHDFVYGWQRAIDPATNSEYAFMISDIAQIKNATAIQAGQMDPNQLGIRAVDDFTLEEQQEGSLQISEALKQMNDNTTEVRTASHEMSVGNKSILSEIEQLRSTTDVIKQSMGKISGSAEDIHASGDSLSEIADSVDSAIKQIGSQIDLFTV